MIEEIDNILDYLQKAGLNTISTDSPAWKLIHNGKRQKLDNSIGFDSKKVDISMGFGNGQKMSDFRRKLYICVSYIVMSIKFY